MILEHSSEKTYHSDGVVGGNGNSDRLALSVRAAALAALAVLTALAVVLLAERTGRRGSSNDGDG